MALLAVRERGPMTELVAGAGRSFEVFGSHIEFNDPGACFACEVEWSPLDMVELHRPGCERIATPAGTPPPGQCWSCGLTPSAEQLAQGIDYAERCTNEGQCSRYQDIQPDYDPDYDEDSIIRYLERRGNEKQEQHAPLLPDNDLPF
jgi:hypothetical protein